MHAKYALALILALQVSVSLCDPPSPSQELVDKYTEMKATFYRRLERLLENALERAQPFLQSENGQVLMAYVDTVSKNPWTEAIRNVFAQLAVELTPYVDEARMRTLARYENKIRPYFGTAIHNTIEIIKPYLNILMPAE